MPEFVYAAVGPELTSYALDSVAASLTAGSSVRLPANVQYAWPHRSGRTLYVASSDGAPTPGKADSKHVLSAFRIDPDTGALSPHGPSVALPTRPIHMTLDPSSGHALVVFNAPAAIRVYSIAADETLGAEIIQTVSTALGTFPHQARLTPDGRHVMIPARGHDAAPGRGEQPGSLHMFRYQDGRLDAPQVVAPDGGYGFGPRHLDFHSRHPWVYVSIERQNELGFMQWGEDGLEPEPRSRLSTLAPGLAGTVHQLAGGIRVHPSGRFVFVSNRAHEIAGSSPQTPLEDGDNTLAVFTIDQATGMPSLFDHVDSHGIHGRNLTIAGGGAILIVSHIAAIPRLDATLRPAGLSLFRIGVDGRLTFQNRYELRTGNDLLFWSGAVTVPGPLED